MVNRKDTWWMRGRNLKPPTSDVTESFISVTDIKHYFYCPRIIYFERVLHAKPLLGSQQKEGGEKHKEYVIKELRRKDAIFYSPDFIGAKKFLFIPLCSVKLGIQGILDLLIKTKEGEYIPVDYKMMETNRGKPWMDHKYQLAAYALLIEDSFKRLVKRGFINYVPEKEIIKIEISPAMKVHVKRVIGHIKKIVSEEKPPLKRATARKCTGGCGYKHLCH